jgi:hypothetical protein
VTPPAEAGTETPARPRVRGAARVHHQTPAPSDRPDQPARPQTTTHAAEPTAAHTRLPVGVLAFAGLGLLLTGELTERLERLEHNLGIAWLNLTFATMIATILVCVTALVGDSALRAAERHTGHRPGARLITPLLALSGSAITIAILVAHLNHPPALDSWTGLAGSQLLLVAAAAHGRPPGAAMRPRKRDTE